MAAIPYEKIVAEDLNLGSGAVDVTMPGGGTASGTKIGLHTFNFFFNAKDYGAVGDGATDDTAALNAAYAAAKAKQAPLYIPPGRYVFSSALTWNGYVSVIGAGRGGAPSHGTTLLKKGTFTGITIEPGAETVEYRDFVLDKHTTGGGGIGIVVRHATGGMSMRNVTITNQGSHGLHMTHGSQCLFENIACSLNGGDGIRIESTGLAYSNANTWVEISCGANGGYGFNIAGGGGGSYAQSVLGLVVQNNTNYGLRINDNTNFIGGVYCENNDAGDLILDTASLRNFVIVQNVSAGIAGVRDLGTNNWIFDFANGLWRVAGGISPIVRPTNAPGVAFSVGAGTAGAGAAGQIGGTLSLAGGDAAGTTGGATGGGVDVEGGAGVNGGARGLMRLQKSGGAIVVGSAAVNSAGSLVELNSTTQALCLTQVTTAQRDAIPAPRNGMLVYNTTTLKVDAYAGGVWVPLH